MFDQGQENGPAPTPFDATNRNDLVLTLFGTDGTTQLALVNNTGAGQAETLSSFSLPAAGQYYARVTGTTANAVQLYDLKLSATAPITVLAGDYNHDGVVDAADYTVWRNWLGTTIYEVVAGLPGDGNEDGVVNQADYDLWRANFGATLAGSGTASVATNTAISGNVGSSGSAPEEAVTVLAENGDSPQAAGHDSIALTRPAAASSHQDGLMAWLAAQTARPSHNDWAEFDANQDLHSGNAQDSAFAKID
jgi:hypothetical protein